MRQWASVPLRLAATLQGYVEQMRVTLRLSSIPHVERTSREFALWLSDQAPEVKAVRDLHRSHLERYKRHLAGKPNIRGGRLSKRTLAGELSTLRICLERLAEWDGEDAPIRKFPDLRVDSVVQIGAAYRLHVPLGKLRTDRYIPLHPQLKELLDEWVASRPANLREPWLFMAHGRRLGPESVRKAILRVANEAGLENVPAHQLRHTLSTHAINRGMSLEAIAALLSTSRYG